MSNINPTFPERRELTAWWEKFSEHERVKRLTLRERDGEIVEYALAGFRDKDIAAKYGVSVGTVERVLGDHRAEHGWARP